MHSKRQKSILKAYVENTIESRKPVPKFYSFVTNSRRTKIPIIQPQYIDKEDYLKADDNIPFVEIHGQNYYWLHDFSSQIIKDGIDYNNPLHNCNLDVKNPGICAFRLYADPDESGKIDFLHVQVRKDSEKPWLFQLDYFEPDDNNNMVNQFISVCDISNGKETVYDLVLNRTTFSTKKAMDIVSKVTCLFRDILIYMRVWAYDEPNNSKLCEVLPFLTFSA